MVRDRVTDGKRIAQLLASELSGLETGPLATVSVVDADGDATPSETGTEAYRLAADGDQIGAVVIYPTAAEVGLTVDPPWPDRREPPPVAAGDRLLRIDSGAAVKPAVDAIREALDRSGVPE